MSYNHKMIVKMTALQFARIPAARNGHPIIQLTSCKLSIGLLNLHHVVALATSNVLDDPPLPPPKNHVMNHYYAHAVFSFN